jgi:ribosomal protein S8
VGVSGKEALFMATKKELTKDQKIKREIARLRRVFKDLDKNKMQTVESLIRNAAFMAVSLEELQEIINRDGYIVEYQNGENQHGTKQSDEVKTHIAMTKNHASIIKQLVDLVPPEKKKQSRLQALRDE